MITKVTKLRLSGVFREFDWPADLDEFLKYNLIYGWNGTGKTTLSNVFRAIQLRHALLPGNEAVLQTSTGLLRSDSFTTCEIPVRVFNRDFVSASVFPVQDSGEVPPIFVLGEDSVEKQKQIEALKEQHAQAVATQQSAETAFSMAVLEFEQYCSTKAQVIKDMLRAPNTTHRYNNYNKATYKNDIQGIGTDEDAGKHKLEDEARDDALIECRATAKDSLAEFALPAVDPDALLDEIRSILNQAVVRTAIKTLSELLEAEQWVAEGMRLHKEATSNTCLYCNNTVSVDRLDDLEAHFNEECERLVSEIDSLLDKARGQAACIDSIEFPDSARLFEHMKSGYEESVKYHNEHRILLMSWYCSAIECLENKRVALNESIACRLAPPPNTERS